MPSRVPKPRKPSEQLRRRNRPEEWTILPSEGCKRAVPKWPTGSPSTVEAALWKRSWALPVAAWWHEQQIEPFIVGRYVALAVSKPAHAAVSRLEADLGLTPAALLRMRLMVEHPEPEPEALPDPYRHLKVVEAE
jgi:hypothetical protein